MRKKEKYYLVDFKIYQYNSGIADNGTFEVRHKCQTLEEAISLKKKIDLVYNTDSIDYDELPEDVRETVENLIYDYTVIGGFIKSRAKVIAKYNVEIEIDII